MKNLAVVAVALLSSFAFAQTGVFLVDPSARPAANITTTTVGADRGLDVNLIGGSIGSTTANQGTSRDGGTDWPVEAKQSGIWIFQLDGGVAINNFPAVYPVTQSTSPWVVSGTVAATQSGGWSVTANAGTNLNTSALNLEATQTAMSAKLPATLGQKTSANSMAVVIASDQSAVPVSLTSTTITGTVAVTQSTSPWVTSNAAIDVNLSTRLAEATFTGRWPAAGALAENFANPTTTQVGAFGMLWDGATWDRAPGNSTDGALVNLGTNNDVTVTSGSISVTSFPDNEPFNIAQVAGATAQSGSGTATGALRVELPTNGTGVVGLNAGNNNIGDVDIVSFPDNEPINVAQMNGVAVTMGNGASGTGVQRVTIANDSTGTVAATQSGTWTVQPGNTPNTSPWLTTDTPRVVASANNTGTCVSVTASTTVLASNASRRAYSFKAAETNTANVHCKLGATATTSNTPFGAGAGWSQDTGAVYTGVVDCIAASGTQSVCPYEFN